jgi:hypothetical protein
MMTHHQNRLLPRLLIMAACASSVPWAPGVAAAAADAWRVTAVQGEATLQRGEAPPAPVAQAQALDPGESLATGASGRVVLTRGASTITVGPNGRMEIPPGGDDGVRTKVVQAMGSLLFKVEKRASQHFEVETPYLAAVVKGTTFTVSVEGDTSAVHVVEGAVEVKALATGQVGLVKPGYTAVVSQRAGKGLSIIGGTQDGSGKAGGGAGKDEVQGEAEPDDGAAGRAEAPGQVKRLHAMLGQASVDVAATSKGFVRNASLANHGAAAATGKGTTTGKAVADGGGKDKAKVKKPAGSPGAAKVAAGNSGGAKSISVARTSPAAGKTAAKSEKARGKLLALLAKAREKALKDRLNVGGGGDDDEDDGEDD